MRKAEKHKFVKEFTDTIKQSNSTILVDYTGFTVAMQESLKNVLRDSGASMQVVKNNLFRIAAKEAKLPEEVYTDTVLTGQTAVITGTDDPIAPLQKIAKFIKDNELPKLKVGIVEGKFQDLDSLVKLSKLPGKEQLQAQVVGAVASPMYGLVGVLQGNLQKLVFVLREASSKA